MKLDSLVGVWQPSARMVEPKTPPQPLPATPEVLAKILERKPILWVGSGLSVAAGYPSSSAIVQEMQKASDDPLDTSQPFFAVADAFVQSMGKAQLTELLQRLCRVSYPPVAAHRALARLADASCFHAVLTTNNDDLIERALNDVRVPYVLQRPEDAVPASGGAQVCVLKLEGSWDDWMRMMVSGRADESLGRRYPFLEEQVRTLLGQRSVLFVGTSLRDPRLLGWIMALSEEEVDALKPWRIVTTQDAWDEVLAYRYKVDGVEHAAMDAITRAQIRPLLLSGHGELPRLLADVAAMMAPLPTTPQMRLKKLTLQDFRGFKAFELTLPEQPVVVLVGVNGSGKTSVLEAVALVFAKGVIPWLKRVHDSVHRLSGKGTPMEEDDTNMPPANHDIREGATEAMMRMEVQWADSPSELRLQLQRSSRALPSVSAFGEPSVATGLEKESVSVLCYYPAGRALEQQSKPLSPPVYRVAQLYAYEHAFDRSLGPFKDFVHWFRLQEDLENEARARGDRASNPLLDAVREAVERFMNALPGGRFSNLRAERAAADHPFSASDQTTLVIDKAGQHLALQQLSQGERTLLLLVADLARRLAIANPARSDPLSGSGIVLIDEVELHLHPGWQRAVLPGLHRAFPGLQIIAATHSPQVLSRLPSESVILLDDFQVAGASPPTYGRDANALLEQVMA